MNNYSNRFKGLLGFTLVCLLLSTGLASAHPLEQGSVTSEEQIDEAHPFGVIAKSVDDTSVVISWKTSSPQTGWMMYGASPNALEQVAYNEQGQDAVDTTHQVTVTGLQPGQVFYYNIVSDGKSYDNAGSSYKVHLGGIRETAREATSANATTGQNQPDGVNAPNDEQIVGGEDADPGEYPWQAMLFMANRSFCGGSLIAPNWVLTAAHCVHGTTVSEVVLGAHYFTQINEPSRQTFIARRTILYDENYVNSPPFYNDIALIELDRPAVLNNRVALIPLAVSPIDDPLFAPHEYELATVAGWGRTVNGDTQPPAPVLQKISVPIVDRQTCLQAYQGYNITSDMLCAGPGTGDEGACQGDSGGPLIARSYGSGRKQVGIVSWGRDGICAQPNVYDIYTVVANYIPWIQQHIGGDCASVNNGVVLYEHLNFTGQCVVVTNYDSHLNNSNFNDITSSIYFPDHYAIGREVILYEHIGYGGGTITLQGSETNLGNQAIGHDRISSLRIRQDPGDQSTLSSGQAINGEINPSSDLDTYFFDANQGQLATIRMNKTSDSLDGYLFLYGPDGREITYNDDGGGNFNPLINRATLPQTGRYRIVAESFNSASRGGYRLSLTLESGGGCTPGANGVVLYEHINYTGRCVTFTDNDVDFINNNFNDIASSIRFVGSYASGWEAVIYQHTYYGGVSSTFRSNDTNFGNDTIGHDRASSIRIRPSNSGNLASGRPAYATSMESSIFLPYRGNDGYSSTRWSSRISTSIGDEWWWTDLGTQTFDQVVIDWETAYASRYFVGWANDDLVFYGYWYTVNAPGRYVHNFLGERTARYAGVLMERPASGYYNYSLWEYEVYRSSAIAASRDQNLDIKLIELSPASELVTLNAPRYIEPLQIQLFLPLIQR